MSVLDVIQTAPPVAQGIRAREAAAARAEQEDTQVVRECNRTGGNYTPEVRVADRKAPEAEGPWKNHTVHVGLQEIRDQIVVRTETTSVA